MRILKRATSVVLSMLLIAAMLAVAPTVSAASVGESKTDASVVYYNGNYYDVLGGLEDLLSRKNPNDIVTDLGALIGYTGSGATISTGKYVKGTDAKHPSYSGTGSSSLATMYEKSERLANDTKSGFRLFYTNDYTTTNNWNREHVWPQSKSGGLYGKSGGGNDLHHIRPTYNSDNSKHGSFPYGNVVNGDEYYCNNNSSSYVIAYIGSGNTMEVVDAYKGDIARIYAYMVTHYPSLYDLINNVMVGGYDTLVEWNNIDPVDAYEVNRNNVAFEYQGNRNPYIDCPDLINAIWGNGTSGDVTYDSDAPVNTDSEKEDSDTTDVSSDKDEYMSLKEAKSVSTGKTISIKGQVTYIYGGNTVILEEVIDDKVESFQVYDQAGVKAGKYPLNAVVGVTGTTSVYNQVKQLKTIATVKTLSTNNKPIAAVECTIPNLKNNLATLVVLRDITLGKYDSTNTIMSDGKGNKVNCYKPASYPAGVSEDDIVDLLCVAYIYNDEVQIRVANSTDYCLDYKDELPVESDDDTTVDTESEEDTEEKEDTEDTEDTEIDTEPEDLNTDTEGGKNDTDIAIGDINNDGKVTMEDIVIAQKIIAMLIEDFADLSIDNFDFNGDGVLTLEDVVHIQRVIAKVK